MILSLLIHFSIQTAFLFAGLWIMILFQKLNYNFPGLLGSAALASALDLVLDLTVGHFLGIELSAYVTTPIVVAVLFFCITKVTEAGRTDVIFTIGVGYALWFAFNMFFLTALLGHGRTHDRREKMDMLPPALVATNAAPRRADPLPAKVEIPVAATNEAIAPSNNAPTAPTKSADDWLKDVTVKGATQNGDKSMLIISANKKNYTLATGELTLVQTTGGPCHLRLMNVSETWATVEVEGEAAYLRIH
jgi:hypothetical protein